MFVSTYRLNLQSIQNPKPTKETQLKNEEATKEFHPLLDAQQTQQTTQPKLPVDYVHSKNYYANRYKLTLNYSPTKEEQNFQTLSKQTQLPQSYKTPHTTFYDLTKPKSALQPSKQHSTLELLSARQNAPKTYTSNNLYYQRTHAS